MTGAREEILARLRTATGDVTTARGQRAAAPAGRSGGGGRQETLDLFAGTVADYRARAVVCGHDEVASAVAGALSRTSCRSVVVPPGLDPGWLSGLDDAVEVLVDDGLTAARLDAVDAVVTAARVGIAATGTIVLDHTADQGRRALTLVPDHHVCVVRADQLVDDVPAAVALLDPARPLTWVSGPSATSDIELSRVEGVHGPRVLDVVVVRCP
jgi:L-lactate dehydrogenase complex protein LldG